MARLNSFAVTGPSSASLGIGWKPRKQNQTIGRSYDGRNTKIPAIANATGRLVSLMLTNGSAHDYPVAQRLIGRSKPTERLLADKVCDGAEWRGWLRERSSRSVSPNQSSRELPLDFSKKACRERHRIENDSCRLKDISRIFTRHAQVGPKFPGHDPPRGHHRLVDVD
jgi:transposase